MASQRSVRRPTRTASSAGPRRKRERARCSRPFGGDLQAELGGIFLLAAAGISLVSLARGPAGYVGGMAANALVSAFGRGSYAVPLLAAVTGLLMLARRTGYVVSIRLIGLLAAASAVVVAFEMNARGDSGLHMGFVQYVQGVAGGTAEAPGRLGGGALGAGAAWAMLRLFGLTGSWIAVIALGAAGLGVAANIPLAVSASWIVRMAWGLICLVFHGIRMGFDYIVINIFEERPGLCSADHASGKSISGGVAGLAPKDPAPSTAESVAQAAVPSGMPSDNGAPIRTASSAHPDARSGPDIETAISASGPLRQLKLIDDSQLTELPPTSLLHAPAKRRGRADAEDPGAQGVILEETLASFGVQAKVAAFSRGPVVTRFEVQPGVGVKVSKIVNLADDLALAFASAGVRIEAPIPGKAAVGIEVPNKEKAFVLFREVLESKEFQDASSRLTMALGKDIAGTPVVSDLADILHLLVAGATGSGKSVCLNSIICSLLFKATPEEVRLLMIDPKRVELSVYDGIPHLLAPVVTDPKKASGYLRWVVEEMENRYRLFQLAGARNIAQYNDMAAKGTIDQFLFDSDGASGADAEPDEDRQGLTASDGGSGAANERPATRPLPYIVVIVDELADLMMIAQGEVEEAIARLAFMARAAGIHLIIATQRPSVDIITGIIKANIPSRIAFAVSSGIDSRIILDTAGAERLLGKGDMLFHPVGLPKPIRVQGAFISDEEVAALVDYLRKRGRPSYEAQSVETSREGPQGIAEDDELFAEAARLVVQTGEASISKVQRRFRVGYARAARLIDTMEVLGIVGPYEGSKPRKVFMSEHELSEALGRRS
ncbi:MAG: DNA translocase FtsK [Clostridia bacterium]|nr:DNA translocase FtsK [Clostridia bacterium]